MARALVGVLLALAVGSAAEAGWVRIDVPATGGYAWRYAPDALVPGEPAPLVVFFHGSGSAPEPWQPILEPLAAERGVVLLLPRSLDVASFGIGDDLGTLAGARDQLEAEIEIDPDRVSLAGHSSGGAFAYTLAFTRRVRAAAVFSLSAPYRPILDAADPLYTPPVRVYYGTDDPNYLGGSYRALTAMLTRLDVPWQAEVAPGFGHSSWPDTTLPQGFDFLLGQRYETAGGCAPRPDRLCLVAGRFEVEVAWRDFAGAEGRGRGVTTSADSALLWFFSPENWELMVKVLDGCGTNGHWWVLGAASTNVELHLTVTDRTTGAEFGYENPLGVLAPALADVEAFPCP